MQRKPVILFRCLIFGLKLHVRVEDMHRVGTGVTVWIYLFKWNISYAISQED